jgi:hypothetical protein
MVANLLRVEISVREEMVLYFSFVIFSLIVTSFEMPEFMLCGRQRS